MIVFTVSPKIIGVLGGMGPEATAQFYKELIKECQRQYRAKYDSDYPEIIICSLPIPDVVEKLKEKEKIISMLDCGLKKLERAGADFIVVPCNTINLFYNEMKEAAKIPIYNTINETVKKVKSKGISCVGVLGTEATLKYKLYKKALEDNSIRSVEPNSEEKKILTKIIMNILEGKKRAADKKELLKIINSLQKQGAEGIILGCTELSLLIKSEDVKIELFDTLKILAEVSILLSVFHR